MNWRAAVKGCRVSFASKNGELGENELTGKLDRGLPGLFTIPVLHLVPVIKREEGTQTARDMIIVWNLHTCSGASFAP